MKAIPISIEFILIVVLTGLGGTATKGLAQETLALREPDLLLNPPIVKRYMLDCVYLSLDPNNPMESYQSYGSNVTSAGAMVGGYIKDDKRCMQILIDSHLKDQRFLIQIKVTPSGNDSVSQAQTIDMDLSDLQARSVEIARNADGRVYWINLTPSIKIIDQKAKRLHESELKLTSFNLQGSPVVTNDTTYLGNMGVSGGTVAFIDHPSIGRIDFAMVPFKEANPAGILMNGHLKLQFNSQTLDIYGVQNGDPAMRLPGGPYTVWVKWTPPAEDQQLPEIPASVEEFMQMVKAQFAEIGQTPPNDDELRAHYEKIKDMKILPLSCGVRGLGKNERVE